MSENVRSALQGIWAHKMRSFLTMLGVIIGIASIISIISTIKGTNDQIMQNLIGAGNNCVTVSLKQGEDDYYMDYGLPTGILQVSDEQIDEIRKQKNVEDASLFFTRTGVEGITAGDNSLSMGTVVGIDANYLHTTGYVVYRGRGFNQADYDNFQKVILLDKTAANILFFDQNPIGQVVDVKGEPFVVVGLVKKTSEFQPVINTYSDYLMYHQDEYGTVYMPDATWPVLYQFDEPQSCIVRANKTENMSTVGQDTAKIMNESVLLNSNTIYYKADDILEKAKNQQELNKSTHNLLIWVAGIALLVGGIGVMNIMLVSVTERTSEIGLKKALGARKKRIMLQFLTESAVLTSIGGAIGVVTGIVLAKIISVVTGAPAAVSIPSIILGVVFSMLIGIIFGLLPSVKAANLNPIDALRWE